MCKVNMQNAIKSKERAAKRGYKVCTSTSKLKWRNSSGEFDCKLHWFICDKDCRAKDINRRCEILIIRNTILKTCDQKKDPAGLAVKR